MSNLSKEKRDRLILISLLIAGVLGALYTFVLGAQKDTLSRLHQQTFAVRDKLSKAERLLRNAPIIEANLAKSKAVLAEKQESMAPQGQYYYWFLQLLDKFRKQENLESNFIIDLTQPELADAGLLPKFPYKSAVFGVRLNGCFRDIGRFMADIENGFPFFRVQNLRIYPQPAALGSAAIRDRSGADPDANQKLMVELRLVTLVKPASS